MSRGKNPDIMPPYLIANLYSNLSRGINPEVRPFPSLFEPQYIPSWTDPC